MKLPAAALFLPVVLNVTHAVAVPCRVATPEAAVLTPMGATIGSGGGIVVANRASDWELIEATAGRAKLEPRAVAPGLDVIAVAGTGSFELRDDNNVFVHVTGGKAKATALPAPKPKQLVATAPKHRGGDFVVTATLASKPPAGAVALIVMAKGTPRSWGRVTAGATSIVVYQGSCQVTPPAGTVRSNTGDTVTLAWLDETGHVSAASAPIKIR